MVLPSKPVSSAKRRASKSPDATPLSKRAASSALEEGELDDSEDPVPPPASSNTNPTNPRPSISISAGPSSLPQKPTAKPKVAFPFKTKKADSQNQASPVVNSAALLSGAASTTSSSAAKGVYARPDEEKWRVSGGGGNDKQPEPFPGDIPPQPKSPPPPAPPPDTRLNNTAIGLPERPAITREEEKKAFGRVFEGCGVKADYEATTKLGEGTFGEVHKAIQKATNRVVALKRILMHNEKEGMPVTALREIIILKALRHECIIEILDMFVVHSTENEPMSVYMVFPYMDHDLAGLLENERVKLQPSQIKLYMKQLLEGTEYMHRNNILHRDMKAANLLISNTGSLRIADFGLARAFDAEEYKGAPYTTFDGRERRERKYTNCVVTRWYRPPELLLGARNYGGEVDIWGIGCVFGEMFSRRPILPGNSDVDQLDRIWGLCGTPNQHTWPNYDKLPGCDGMKRFTATTSRRIKQLYESIGPETVDLLDQLLICNPKERISASQALEHDYFWTDPLPADPKTLPAYEASHEFDKRSHRQHQPPGPPGNGPQPPYNNHNHDRRNRLPPPPNRPYPNRPRGDGQYRNRNHQPPPPHGPPIHFSGGYGNAPPPGPMPGAYNNNNNNRSGHPHYRDNRSAPRYNDNPLPNSDSLPPRPLAPMGASGGRSGSGSNVGGRGPGSSNGGSDTLNYGPTHRKQMGSLTILVIFSLNIYLLYIEHSI
ncbi:Pkinase-domain-containing protein [Lentinula edodes]|uniref:Pkinase-domain-containing protein n=1 Tax=Lentinula edodes TaxID=5353 RepID=A0A1Q3DXU8_LENED|nr:Pkinase-domain-containing protein [Lentinula edodes]